MPITLETKSTEQLLAEADELIQKNNSEHLEDLEEEHHLRFQKHAKKLQEIKSVVLAKPRRKERWSPFPRPKECTRPSLILLRP